MRLKSFIGIYALFCMTAACFAASPNSNQYDQYKLVLKQGDLEGEDVTIHVFTSDNEISRIFAYASEGMGRVFGKMTPEYLNVPDIHKQIEDGAVANQNQLKISFIMMVYPGNKKDKVLEHHYTIIATIDGKNITGNFEGKIAEEQFGLDYNTSERPDNLALTSISGNLEGEFHDYSYSKRLNQVKNEAGWSSWQGDHGNFSGYEGAKDYEYVESLYNARLAWVSEDFMTTGSSTPGGMGYRYQPLSNGGAAQPVINDGLVYQYFYAPTGEDFEDPCSERKGPSPGTRFASAHDVVVALETNTGKTVWKQVFEDMGLRWMNHKTELANNTPVVSDDKIYAMGSTARIYAMDKKTGEVEWDKGFPEQHEYLQKQKELRLSGDKNGCKGYSGRSGGHGLAFADGVLAACELGNGSKIVAYDGQTGDSLWMKQAVGRHITPTKWEHQGKEYFIISNEEKTLCVLPKTGEELWEINDGGDYQFILNEGYLILHSGNVYNITPEKAEKKYEFGSGQINGPIGVIMDGYAYIRTNKFTLYNLDNGQKVAELDGEVFGPQAEATLVGEGTRIVYDDDAQHGKTYPLLVNASPDQFSPLDQEKWYAPNPHTTGYEVPFALPLVDGRLFVRGADGIYCYDLRKPESFNVSTRFQLPAHRPGPEGLFLQDNNLLYRLNQNGSSRTLDIKGIGK